MNIFSFALAAFMVSGRSRSKASVLGRSTCFGRIGCFRASCMLVVSVGITAQAAPIPGLFNTGVSPNGSLLAAGAIDPHYRLVQSADPTFPGPNAFVVTDAWPVAPAGPWLAHGPASKWIAPQAPQGTGNSPGNYTYRLTFSLEGFNPATAVITGRWSSDNAGVDVRLNGVSTGITFDGNFGAFSPQFTINSGFVAGTNTLDFIVNNAGTTVNPTGFRAELSGTADFIAPPETPPQILTHPQSQTAFSSDSASFAVTVYGSEPLSFQWRLNGENISGATNALLVLTGLSPAHAGSYDVVARNPWGEAASNPATLTVTVYNPSPAELTYEPIGPSSRRTGLVISEIMYRPAARSDGKNLEFIELYNTNPFFEDLSGYRIEGDASYTFPAGTVLQGNSFLVIAGSPQDVSSEYGISGVLGGWSGNLPNNAGTIRLVKRSGGIVLEVPYAADPPWPVAADGAGHSLVLSRPSYGESNPAAWSASARKGGSPGAPDPVPTGDLENVRINELLARSADPALDFIELYNYSIVPVDLSGCFLTDSRNTNKFRIPDGTSIPAGGFVVFDQNQLGFGLSSSGETVYFVNPDNTRVIEAVRFGATANGVSIGRSPDGAPDFQELAVLTPGVANSRPMQRDVVINEIMFNPVSKLREDQFVELHNRGPAAVDVSGWRIDDGIRFTIPDGTVIPAGGYLVIAKNAERLRANYLNLNDSNLVGDFSGNLSNSGERLALLMPDHVLQTNASGVISTHTLWITVNEVHYKDGGRWGLRADGGGSSLELIDPRSDNRLASNWADSDERDKAGWSLVEHTGVLDHGNGACDSLQIMLLGAGEALIDDVEVFVVGGPNRISNPGFENGVAGWAFQGTHSKSGWNMTEGYNSARSLHLRASGRGDLAANRIRTTLTSALSPGANVTIRAKVRWLAGDPEILFRLRGNYLEAAGILAVPPNLGTPGAPNSRAVSNAGPAISDVSHRPALPAAHRPIRVTARIHDPDGIQTAVLKYRFDPSPDLLSVPMNDDGQNGDLIAGDGIFTGTIPGQSSGTLIAFHVEARDDFTPAAIARFPAEVPVRECLVRVGETVPPGAFGTYRFWITQANHNYWASREKMSNEQVDATFVYGTNRVIYNMGALYSGSSYTSPSYTSPTGTLCGYNMIFPKDDKLLGMTDFVLDWPVRDNTNQREQLMFWFLEQYGLPNTYRRYVHLFVNGVRRGTIYDDVQQPNRDMVEEFFSYDSEGTLWKTDCWSEFDDAGNRLGCTLNTLENFLTTGGVKKTARYRWNWRPRAVRGSAHDFREIFDLVDALNTPGAAYQSAVENLVDVEHWMRTFAMNDLASYWDGFGNPNAKNTYLYKPLTDTWKLLCWDFDVGLGVFNDPPDAPLFPNNVDPTMQRMYAHPAFVRAYWRALEEALNGFFQAQFIDPILDAKYAAFQANNIGFSSPAGIKSWIAQRRSFLLQQLNSVSAGFGITTQGGNNFSTNRSFITLSGTAPVRVKSVLINGAPYPASWSTVTGWSIQVPLQPGVNPLHITGIDLRGEPVPGASRTIEITYEGTVDQPEGSLVINEIMYHPITPGAEFIELYNRSSTTAFDLGGWRLNGAGYIFPGGTLIPPNGFLVIAKNRAVFGAAYGAIPVIGEFPGQLDKGGETLSLIKPGAAPLQDAIICQVRYDDDPPWPVAAAGSGPSLQLIDPAQDINRVANWSDGSGWRFASYTGVNSSTRLLIFLGAAGDIYIDDLMLVPGTVPAVGENVIRNGDFESELSGPWVISPNHSNSYISTEIRRAGQGSLHLIATSAGTSQATAIHQDTLPIQTNTVYTLSFWYLPTTNATNLTLRTGSTFRPVFNPAPVWFTPGRSNSSLASVPPFPLVWLNELQPHNVSGPADRFGQRDPWVELYNAGDEPIDLSAFHLTDDYSRLPAWSFPPGAAIGPGEFKLVWLDNQPEQSTATEWHANFRIDPLRGSVALVQTVNGEARIVDYLNYSGIPAGQSFGAFPDGRSLSRAILFQPTPAAPNNNQAPPWKIWINEWMASNTRTVADPADGNFDDWFELYNPQNTPVDLSGYSLTDRLSQPRKYVIPQGVIIPPLGYLLVWADEQSSQTQIDGDLHVNFKLSKSGEELGLFAPNGDLVDSVVFGAQTDDVSQGRWPDGAGEPFHFMPAPTPRAPNIIPGIHPEIRVVGPVIASDGSITLTWNAVPGSIYRVQFKASLDAAQWENVSGEIAAVEGIASAGQLSVGGNQGYYRILFVR
jgi:hypothetical protein